MRRFLKVILIALVLLVAVVVALKLDGIQYVFALATGSFSKPYFDVSAYLQSPNCDGTDSCESGPIRVMTYNVLCRPCVKEGFDPWDERLPHLQEMIARYDADLLGLQELGGFGDIETFARVFPQYEYVTYTFSEWAYGDCALFYRKERFEALDSGQMWLGPKPTVPLGAGWKALAMPRYVNWVYLRQKSNGFRFLYVNTHFDNNTRNKEASASLFAKTFAPLAAVMPIIVTGDFNTNQQVARYRNLKGDTGTSRVFDDVFDLASEKKVIQNIPDGVKALRAEFFTDPARAIDHIFLAGPVEKNVSRWIEDASVYGQDNRWPSDHPAVYAEVGLRMRSEARSQ
jgi:endonuclease/exonuclease/phosphatase family metal-dependent hydrolase